MRVVVGGVRLYVERKGAGDVSLVFLHYWGGTHRTWSKVIVELVGRFASVAYDLRGWGDSDSDSDSAASSRGYSISALADEASALIEELGLRKYVLIGHSMGGKVAQLVASRRPAGLKGLVLVAPASPTPTRFPEEAMQQQIHAYDNRETVLQTIAFLSARTPAPEIVEQIVEDSLSGVPEAKLAWPTQAILEDISEEVTKISVPTIVLAGELDRLDSVEQHRREILSRIPGARLEIIGGSGHLSPIDEPEKLARAIEAFVGELPE
jgi:pimeloyl-ACP methyl ester carboxylesterase